MKVGDTVKKVLVKITPYYECDIPYAEELVDNITTFEQGEHLDLLYDTILTPPMFNSHDITL